MAYNSGRQNYNQAPPPRRRSTGSNFLQGLGLGDGAVSAPIVIGSGILLINIMLCCLCCFCVIIFAALADESTFSSATSTPRPTRQARQIIEPVAPAPQQQQPGTEQNAIPETTTPQQNEAPTPLPAGQGVVPQAPSSQPIIITGVGNAIEAVNKWEGAAIVQITGNDNATNFIITPYDAEGNRLEDLVNTTNPYNGRVLIDYEVGRQTTRLEISSDSGWGIEILPLTSAATLNVPGEVSGQGDDVILLAGTVPDTAMITGNNEAQRFSVVPYAADYRLSLMVNTAAPYQGEVFVDPATKVLQIKATGGWSIAINAAQ